MSTLTMVNLEAPSIDAVLLTPTDTLFTAPQTPTQDNGPSSPPIKIKGRQRLLLGLQRISSSPSLLRLGRPSPGGYSSNGKGSMSCVSLASSGYSNGLQYPNSYESEMSARYSTAPTSVAGTPGPGSPLNERFSGGRSRAGTGSKEMFGSVGLPSEVQRGLPPSIRVQDVAEDYFSRPITLSKPPIRRRRSNFNFWRDLPSELAMEVLTYLAPKQIVRCSRVSKAWHKMCFDGQLWGNLDTAGYYHDIPAQSLVKIVASAGPFVRDLNLRGCVQLRERWQSPGFSDACRNLENFSLEGCIIDRSSIHCFLLQNSRLVHINLTGLNNADNATMKIIGQHCPRVEHLNITWCPRIDAQGLQHVVRGCPDLRDLRAGEIRGLDDTSLMLELFQRNTLERLIFTHCDSFTDAALTVLIEGTDPEFDYVLGRPIVPPRRLRHLDLARCRSLTDAGIKKLAFNVPFLEGLQLSKNSELTDEALLTLLPTMPNLTHLDVEELELLTNNVLERLAEAPCKATLQHLNISYCENLGDTGMLPVLKACSSLTSLEMDNTKISDLTLTEAAESMRARNKLAGSRWLSCNERPSVGLRIVAYDCAHVTWTGVREILSRNTEGLKVQRTPQLTSPLASPSTTSLSLVMSNASPPLSPASTNTNFNFSTSSIQISVPPVHPNRQQFTTLYPPAIISLKCFYNWQPTVEEHTKRCLRGNFPAAIRLERKWAEWMVLNEEAGASGSRRRRRRAREARMMHDDDEEMENGSGGNGMDGLNGIGSGGRRRARSGPAGVGGEGPGCIIM